MAKLPKLGSKQLLRRLFKLGFYEHHQSGSHINLRHQTKFHLHVTVPGGRDVLSPKTLKTILKQAELSTEDLMK